MLEFATEEKEVLMQKILFIIDKIELKYFEFNNLVTNFWLIKEFLERNLEVYITTTPLLSLKNKSAYTKCYKTYCLDENIFYNKNLLEEKDDLFTCHVKEINDMKSKWEN